MIETFDLGDIVQMKKQHPCGSKEFEVIRLGADIKIKCVGELSWYHDQNSKKMQKRSLKQVIKIKILEKYKIKW